MGNQILTEGTPCWGRLRTLGQGQRQSGLQLSTTTACIQSTFDRAGLVQNKRGLRKCLGGHLYRFQIAGLSSNDLRVLDPEAIPRIQLTGRVVDQSGQGWSGQGTRPTATAEDFPRSQMRAATMPWM